MTLELPETTARASRKLARVAAIVAAGVVVGGMIALGVRYFRDR